VSALPRSKLQKPLQVLVHHRYEMVDEIDGTV
jgi:hypothetical protein